MPRDMNPPKYFNFKETPAGTQLVSKGEYVGETEGKYGVNFNFMEIESGQHVILSGGALKWRVEQGHMVEGEVFDIWFEGKETIQKGQYSGKEVNNFKLAKYEDHELPEKYRRPGKFAAPVATAPAPVATGARSQALDDLE